MSSQSVQPTVPGLIAQISSLISQTWQHVSAGSATKQVTIQPGAVYRVAIGYRTVRVVRGDAWLTQYGRDIFLSAGDPLLLAPDPNGTLISALRQQKVVLELH